ncbi:hypothetical protein [Planctomycetes bacterium K23_9]
MGPSRSSSLSRSLPSSSIGSRHGGPPHSSFHPGRGHGSSYGRSYSPSHSLYGSRRPSSGLSISIGTGYSPSYRYGSLGRSYGLRSSYPYSSGYGGYSSGYGYSPYYSSSRSSIGLSLYADPLRYSQPYVQRYPSTSSTYRYTQPVSPYTSSQYSSSAYADSAYQSYREPSQGIAPQYDSQPMQNPYAGSTPSTLAPQRSSGDPSDPNTELQAGMILPDGSRVISVGALPAADAVPEQSSRMETGTATEQPTALTPAQPISSQTTPVQSAAQSTGQSLLQEVPAEPVPAPAQIAPAGDGSEEQAEELPVGNAEKAEDV